MTEQPPRRLAPGRTAALILGAGALTLVLICLGALTAIGAMVGDPQQIRPAAEAGDDRGDNPADIVTPASPSPPTVTATPAASQAPTASPEATTAAGSPSSAAAAPLARRQPRVEKRSVVTTRAIPFTQRTVRDSSLAQGKRRVLTRGVAGVKTLTYEVTVTDGVQTGRRLVREVVTRRPTTKVIAIGTRTAPACDPNYSGCVPVASDVDCAGGSGNGPAYVSGVVKVTGTDIYDLDRDNDGYGCD